MTLCQYYRRYDTLPVLVRFAWLEGTLLPYGLGGKLQEKCTRIVPLEVEIKDYPALNPGKNYVGIMMSNQQAELDFCLGEIKNITRWGTHFHSNNIELYH